MLLLLRAVKDIVTSNVNANESDISKELKQLNDNINIKENEVYNCRKSDSELKDRYNAKKQLMASMGLTNTK